MLLRVRVTPNSRQPQVTKLAEDSYEVKVDERAEDGRANKRLIEILSKELEVSKSRVSIVRGAKSRDKVVSVD